MKRSKIILFFLFGIASFLINSKALADEPFVGYLECTYYYEHERSLIGDYNMQYRTTRFYFSELEINGGLANDLLYKSGNHHYGWDSIAMIYNPVILESTEQDLKKLPGRFRTAYENNGATCPKYYVLKYLGKSRVSLKYTPYFSNDQTEYCGSDLSGCIAIASLQNTERILVYGNEKEWEFKTDCERDKDGKCKSDKSPCDNANVRLYISGKKLIGEILYPKTSTFYDESAKHPVAVDVKIDDENLYLNYIYDLLKNNKIKNGFIRGDAGNEKVVFNDSGVAKSSCDILENKIVAPKYNCTQFQIFQATLIGYKSKYASLRVVFRTANNISFNKIEQAITTANAETLEGYRKTISNYNSDGIYGKKWKDLYKEYSDYLKRINEELCIADKEKLTTYVEELNSSEILDVINEAAKLLNKISIRFEELGEEEKAKRAAEEALRMEELMKEMKKYYSVTENELLIKGKFDNLVITSDCQIISTEMGQWLKSLLDFIKILALMLTIILGMLDFTKATLSGEADTMKKTWKNFSRRLLAVVLLFLLPVIIEFILNVVKIDGVIANDPLCQSQIK